MGLSSRIVHLHCECPAEVAAARFTQRKRSRAHLDHARSREQVLTNLQGLAQLDPLDIGERISVDTSAEIKLEVLAMKISAAFERF